MQEFNDWNVPFSVIKFFEDAITAHRKVAECQRTDDIFFTITRTDGRTLKVLLVNEYTLGLAAVYRATSEFPAAEYIVTGGNWNGHTSEAKEYGRQNSIGIFNTSEFFGALHWAEPKDYYKKDQDGNPVYDYHDS
jgi:hypothetical protein